MAINGISMMVLDSRDRLTQSNTSTDCFFQFNPGFRATKAEVVSLQMPFSMYNINTSNNIVYFTDGGINKQFIITPGNYSIYDLLEVLELGFNSVSANYVVSYSNISQKISITSLILFTLRFSILTNSAAYILGFNLVNTPSALVHTSANNIDLSLPLYFYCTIKEFDTNLKTTNSADMGTFVFKNNVNGGDHLQFSENTDYNQCSFISEANIQGLHIRFTTHGNRTLDINNNNWSMILRLHYCQC